MDVIKLIESISFAGFFYCFLLIILNPNNLENKSFKVKLVLGIIFLCLHIWAQKC